MTDRDRMLDKINDASNYLKENFNSSEFINTNLALSSVDNNSEDVLPRHLLKLSEIENHFQELSNKFEETTKDFLDELISISIKS